MSEDEKDAYRHPVKVYIVYIGTSRNLPQTEEVDEQSAELLRSHMSRYVFIYSYQMNHRSTSRSITLSTLYVSIAIYTI